MVTNYITFIFYILIIYGNVMLYVKIKRNKLNDIKI